MSFRACARASRLLPHTRATKQAIPVVRRYISTGPNSPTSHKVSGDHDLESVWNMFDLKNKNFVVTGGARGIGYAVTRAIAEMGGNVAVLDVLDSPNKDWETLTQQIDRDFKLEYIK